MSDAKHTPGPWFIDGHDRNGQRIVRQEHMEIATCWHHCVQSIAEEMEANARLIAAAPELLEALQLVVDKLGSDFELYREQQFAIDTARAAIAKATGSTHV
jgi:hypothetical protein